LQHRTWEQDGQKRSKVEVVVEDFNFIGSADSNSDGNSSQSSSSSNNSKPKQTDSKNNEDVVIEDIDDEPVDLSDIPF
jgi:single-strand DNA-binding protein